MRFILLFTFCLFQLTQASAQKKVVIEKFTNFSCGACAGAAYVIKDIQEEQPDLIWISHHKPVDWIDNELNNDDSAAIWWDLDGPGNPTAMIDRTSGSSGLIATSPRWATRIEEQLQKKPLAQINVNDVDFDADTRTFTFDLEVIFDEAPASDRFSISAIMVEDRVRSMHQHSYFNTVAGHPLEGRGDIIYDYEHRNVVRAILDNPWGSNTVIPPNPEIAKSYEMSYSYQVPDTYQLDKMKIVGLISLHDEDDMRNRPVLNATEIDLNELGFQLSNVVEAEAGSIVSISPNPSASVINVEFHRLPRSIELLDIDGKTIIHRNNFAGNKMAIDVTELRAGNYIFLSHYENETRAQKIQIY